MENLNIPKHVAIIIDGNGRWAKEKGKSRLEGHDAGYQNIKRIGKYILKRGVKYLSIYAFSTENFKRDEAEVNHLMDIFLLMVNKDIDFFVKNNIKVVFSGRDEPLTKKVIDARNKMAKLTENNTGGVLNLCLNYGGRSEIVDATKKIVADGLKPEEITEEVFSRYLYQDLPDVDLMIRTSGELRLSNFLLWQNSYSEFYFPEKKFPDFNEEDFEEALLVYNKRDRRFGDAKK